MKKKFLFLYIQAGGGHISTAKAIAKYIDQHYEKVIHPVLVDGFTEAPRWLKKVIIDGYKKSQTTGQRVYELLYRLNEQRVFAKISQMILCRLVQGYIKKVILQQRPTQMVILHFFLVRPTIKMLKKLKINIPVTTIITDPFSINRLRVVEKDMDYIVFSERARDTAVKRGVPHHKIRIHPTILKQEFNHLLSAEQIIEKKKQFGLSLEKKTIFIMWAGDGIPKGEKILQELVDTKINAQIMIVCGKNQKLERQANKIASLHPEYIIKVFGFVNFMYDLVNISDIIITKWWPATIMEILMMKKIPVINSYIRWQEKWNMEFVVDNKLGFYEPNVKKMIWIIKNMLDGWDITEYQNNIKNLHLRNGTEEVAEYLIGK